MKGFTTIDKSTYKYYNYFSETNSYYNNLSSFNFIRIEFVYNGYSYVGFIFITNNSIDNNMSKTSIYKTKCRFFKLPGVMKRFIKLFTSEKYIKLDGDRCKIDNVEILDSIITYTISKT
jgi:hypothetical protein